MSNSKVMIKLKFKNTLSQFLFSRSCKELQLLITKKIYFAFALQLDKLNNYFRFVHWAQFKYGRKKAVFLFFFFSLSIQFNSLNTLSKKNA